nr:uroporphyrinogen-III C-methyltransferase [uncultured Pseudomonas sp.]
MSEAVSTQDQDQPSRDGTTGAPSTPPQVAAKPTARGNGLALLALLVGAVGAAAGGWGVWQMQGLQNRQQQYAGQLQEMQQTQVGHDEAQSLAQTSEKLNARLAQLPTADELESQRRLLARLQGDQQLLNQRLETVLGASRQEWRLAEAEHLLRLASLRLSALQDINSATALVRAADDILQGQDDPAAFTAREQLAKSLAALRATPDPDRTGLFLQLGALRDQVAQLNAKAPTFTADGGVLGELAATEGEAVWWKTWLRTLSEYFRVDFNADSNIRPVLAGQSLLQVRLALSLALEQAQWAALHGETAVYRQALQQAREVLDAHFEAENPNSRALRVRIDELFDTPIEVQAPDLSQSLNAVEAYIEAKQSARQALGVEAPASADVEEARP